MGTQLPMKRGTAAPTFRPMSIVAKRSPISAIAELLFFLYLRFAAGPSHYVRTCSNNLNHRLTLSLVCMKESPPGNGRLCFCHRPLCNSAAAADVWHRPPFAFVPPATPLVLLPPLLLTLRHAMVTVAMDATSAD